MTSYTIVIPTIGRPSLIRTLLSLHEAQGPPPEAVVLVDDRPLDAPPLPPVLPPPVWPTSVLRTGGRGPAAARNAGWRTARTPWVVFLDDDVEVPPAWLERLAADLAAAGSDIGGVQGRVQVPLGDHPTDAERDTAGLERATWATADMAYRRAALLEVSGFDERFRRAYREDADLALRVQAAGWHLVRGTRTVHHPPRPDDGWASLRAQAGNADDVLMRRRHGPNWRSRAWTGRGRFAGHLATVAAAALVVLGAGTGRRWPVLAGAVWVGLTGDFARRRIAPGPRPGQSGWAREWRAMLLTSVLIPFAAVWHRLRGEIRYRNAGSWPPPIRAVLFDRDGTLLHDVPYNSNPAYVLPVPQARAVLDELRGRGIKVGVITNQSGIARGHLTPDELAAVHRRVEYELGPFDTWQHCPHDADAGCPCRKPQPGMVLAAARELGVAPYECAVVGDIGSDVAAAVAAGATAVLVPTTITRVEEIDAAPTVATSLGEAVELCTAA